MSEKINLQDLSFNLSNYCLGACKYCTLWQKKHWKLSEELNLNEIELLFSDPILDGLKTIHITGGAPMLSPKFIGLVDILYEYHRNCPINSPVSGAYPEVMRRLMGYTVRKLPQYRLNVALEGATKQMHEKIRGPNSWDSLWQTVEIIDDLGCNWRFNFSLYPENYREIRKVKEIADKWGVNLYINFGRFSFRFGNEKDGIMYVPQEEIEFLDPALKDIGWLKERRLNKQKWILQKVFWERKKVRFECLAGHESLDVDPWGNVYPCLMYPQELKFGNIREFDDSTPLTSIWGQESVKQKLQEIITGECSKSCPFTCALRIRNITIDGYDVNF